MIFTINCPSCTSELVIIEKIMEEYKKKHGNIIKKLDKSQLTRLPDIDYTPIIEESGIKACCVAELVSRVNRTISVYGQNHM